MNNIITIEPLKGCGEISFGQAMDDAVKIIGAPTYYEELVDIEDIGNRTIFCQYEDLNLNIYFEGITKSVVACFDTDNEDALLYGEKVFDLNRSQVIDLMKKNGYSDIEQEMEEDEFRISFNDCLVDFYFIDEELQAVNWSVLVDEQGNII
jgi:hypothetical protein